jgi:DHA2 family multidrug resistance protein-like MFS transporter
MRPPLLSAAGSGILTIGLVMTAMPPRGHEIATFLAGTVLAGIGFGLFLPPNNRTLLLAASKARSGAAGAMQATARTIGQTIGSISMSMVFGMVAVNRAPRVGVMVAAGFASISGLISLWGLKFSGIGKSVSVGSSRSR